MIYSSNALNNIDKTTPSYSNACVPTVITNMLGTYYNWIGEWPSKQRLGLIFEDVIQLGFNNGIYDSTGVNPQDTYSYIQIAFDNFNISCNYDDVDTNYDAIRSSLANDCVLYIEWSDYAVYGYHGLFGYAYTRLCSSSTGAYKTYVKVADGNNTNKNRFLDLAHIRNDRIMSIQFT